MKEKLSRKQKKALKKKKKEWKKQNRKIPRFLKVLLVFTVLFLALLCVYYGSGVGGKVDKMRTEADELVSRSSDATFRASQTSQVYDSEGELITTLRGEKNLYYLEYTDIPTYVKSSFVCVEDKKFFSHGGVDYKAILRALLSYVKNGEITQGGSTITQQLSRNIFLSHEVSWERKVEEIFIAWNLEDKYSKEKILEYYINNIYFANGNYGIQAASKSYFNRDIHDLTLSQTAFLCAIPNNPTLYNPLTNMENTIKRRDRILLQLKEDGIINEADYQSAIKEAIVLDIPVTEKSDYVETFAYYCATRALMEYNGFEFRYAFDSESQRNNYQEAYESAYNSAQKTLFTAGYKIYTSINMTQQDLLQQSIDKRLEDFTDTSEEGVYKLQASATCIDNSTGLVTAIVGGRSQEFAGYSLNRAYQSFRQPGSAIKPLIVYTPCLEQGYTANTKVRDKKIKDGPSNSNGSYEGTITLRRAVAKSKNTVAWNLFKELTPTVGLSYLLDMEFSKIVKDDYNLPAALGGLTNGTSSLELAGGYATIANDGIYRTPTCIVRIADADGNTIYSSDRTGKEVYKKNAARSMTDLLQSVIKEGTGRGLALTNMPVAGKTGTTNDNKDGWFAGYSPYYTTTVWVGYDIPASLSSLHGSSYPGDIWKDFMEEIHKDLTYKKFETPHKDVSNQQPKPQETTVPVETTKPAAIPTAAPQHTPQPTVPPTSRPVSTPKPTVLPSETPEPTVEPEVSFEPPAASTEPLPVPESSPEPPSISLEPAPTEPPLEQESVESEPANPQ